MPAAATAVVSAQEWREQIFLQIQQHVAAKDGKIRVCCDVHPPDLKLTADPGQLTQMTLNLAINACEAMDYKGSLRIALNLVGGGEGCELVVTDNGPGIEPEIRDALFSPFKTTKEGGTGLGLSIVARIASAHGGDVRVEDAPGGGAIFRVRWPLDRVLLDEENPAGPDADPVAADGDRLQRSTLDRRPGIAAPAPAFCPTATGRPANRDFSRNDGEKLFCIRRPTGRAWTHDT